MSPARTRGGRPALAQWRDVHHDAAGIPPPYGVPADHGDGSQRAHPPRGDATHRPVAGREGGGRGPAHSSPRPEAELAGLLHAEGIVALVADAESLARRAHRRGVGQSRSGERVARVRLQQKRHPPGPGRRPRGPRSPTSRRSPTPLQRYYLPQAPRRSGFTAELDALGRGAGLDGGRRRGTGPTTLEPARVARKRVAQWSEQK